mgnify:CR=1 FL=1
MIAPTKQGMAGTVELNSRLQAAINPPDRAKSECRVGNLLLREGAAENEELKKRMPAIVSEFVEINNLILESDYYKEENPGIF